MALTNPRAQRGLQILAAGGDGVLRLSNKRYRVKSQSNGGFYDVRYDGSLWSCTCPDYTSAAQFCKHLWAVQLSKKIRAAVEADTPAQVLAKAPEDVIECAHCGSAHVIRKGVRKCQKGMVPRFLCKACGRKFIRDRTFARIHTDAKAVVTAFDLWAKKVSYRQIAHHLKDVQGVNVGKSTIERWVRKMGALLASYADACEPKVGEIWHADETTINVDGKMRWTWNVMDHQTRFWLASTVTETKKPADAQRPLRKAREVAHGNPSALITDGNPSYRLAVWRELNTVKLPTQHLVIPPLRSVPTDKDHGVHPGNNICERLQGTQRERTKIMRGFDFEPSAQVLIDGFRGYYNVVRPHLGLNGLTPAEAAGVPLPPSVGGGRLEAILRQAAVRRKAPPKTV